MRNNDGAMTSLQVLPGSPTPLGATSDPRGTNFAVSSGGDRVTLCLFDRHGNQLWCVAEELLV